MNWQNGSLWDPAQAIPETFYELYESIYRRHLPRAHPESKALIAFQFSHEHDYFKTGKAWMALRPNQIRLCGFIQEGITLKGQKVGYFGFWETTENLSLNQELFAKLEAWMRAEGVTYLVGPVNFTTFGHYRLRDAAAPEDLVFLDEPLSPSYYEKFIEACGFQKIERYSSLFVHPHPNLRQYFEELYQKLHTGPLADYQLLPLNAATWQANIRDFYELTLRIFGGNPAFVPISFGDYQRYYGEYTARSLCPHSSLLVRDARDELVGYVSSYPDYGPLLSLEQGRYRLEELNFERCFAELPYRTQIGKTVGIVPEHRGQGLQFLMTAKSAIQAFSAGYDSIVLALMREGNVSQKVKPPFPVGERHYSLYGKPLGSPT